MDEEEYDKYLNLIDAIDPLLDIEAGSSEEYEVLRDENGFVVPGCFRRKPLHVEYE